MSEDQSVVLLVEDEPLIRLYIAELLEDAGFRVLEAANAREALEILEAGLPVDVLLTDVDMSTGNDGFELAQEVHRSWPEVEMLIMSGRRSPARGDLPPGTAFLAKPCPNEVIVSYVHSAAERSRKASRSGSSRTASGAAQAKILAFPKSA